MILLYILYMNETLKKTGACSCRNAEEDSAWLTEAAAEISEGVYS